MYYQIVEMSGQFYAKSFNSLAWEESDILSLMDNGEIVLLCDDLEGAADFLGVSISDIQIIN